MCSMKQYCHVHENMHEALAFLMIFFFHYVILYRTLALKNIPLQKIVEESPHLYRWLIVKFRHS